MPANQGRAMRLMAVLIGAAALAGFGCQSGTARRSEALQAVPAAEGSQLPSQINEESR